MGSKRSHVKPPRKSSPGPRGPRTYSAQQRAAAFALTDLARSLEAFSLETSDMPQDAPPAMSDSAAALPGHVSPVLDPPQSLATTASSSEADENRIDRQDAQPKRASMSMDGLAREWSRWSQGPLDERL